MLSLSCSLSSSISSLSSSSLLSSIYSKLVSLILKCVLILFIYSSLFNYERCSSQLDPSDRDILSKLFLSAFYFILLSFAICFSFIFSWHFLIASSFIIQALRSLLIPFCSRSSYASENSCFIWYNWFKERIRISESSCA